MRRRAGSRTRARRRGSSRRCPSAPSSAAATSSAKTGAGQRLFSARGEKTPEQHADAECLDGKCKPAHPHACFTARRASQLVPPRDGQHRQGEHQRQHAAEWPIARAEERFLDHVADDPVVLAAEDFRDREHAEHRDEHQRRPGEHPRQRQREGDAPEAAPGIGAEILRGVEQPRDRAFPGWCRAAGIMTAGARTPCRRSPRSG